MTITYLNNIDAEGTPLQITAFHTAMKEKFGKDITYDKYFPKKTNATLSIILLSKDDIPKHDLIAITKSLKDTRGLHIKMSSDERPHNTTYHAVFENSKWSFENPDNQNRCVNIINVRGTYELTDSFLKKLSARFRDELILNDSMRDRLTGVNFLTMLVYTKEKAPQKELLAICASMPDTKGLSIRVVSENPFTLYEEDSRFTDGQWSFKSQADTSSNKS